MTSITSQMLHDHSVVVCVGTGGVGKTSVAAALALTAAGEGRSVALVTIDPARRLADALGLSALGNEPRPVPIDGSGRLDALMLDAKSTFDGLVTTYARDSEQSDRILASRFYKNVSTSLSGTHEYMAMEKLYELHSSRSYDLLVVDTPPTRSAIAFLDAPMLLSRLLDNWLYRVLTAPGRGMVRAANKAAQVALRQLSRIVGAEVVEDAVMFFQAFEGMEDGFRDRAQSVLALLKSTDTAFVLVASPHDDALAEADHFIGQLEASSIGIDAVIANKMTPRFDSSTADAPAVARANLDMLIARRAREDSVLDAFTGSLDSAVIRVPTLESDIHDVDSLQALAEAIETAAA